MSDGDWKDGKGEYNIDPALIKKWFELPHNEEISITLPRVALDALYVAIERPYFMAASITNYIIAQNEGDEEEADKAYNEIKDSAVYGLNFLKHYQTVLMARATDTQLDPDGRVIEEDDSDGE